MQINLPILFIQKGDNKLTENVKASKILKLKTILIRAIKNTISNVERPGLLFSGGLDSSILAALLSGLSTSNVSLLVSGTESSKDVNAARAAASILELPLEIRIFTIDELERMLPEILKAAKSTDVLQVSLAVPLFFATKKAKELGISTLLTGQGADELFGGYERFERLIIREGPEATAAEMKKAFNQLITTALPCQQAVANHNSIQLAAPYLNPEVVSFASNLCLDNKICVSKDRVIRKHILRELAKNMGLPSEITHAPKRALQYGSGTSHLLSKLAKQFWKKVNPSLSSREASTHLRIQQFLFSLQNK